MNHLKIISKGWQGYNGQLNIIAFKNGVSTEPVPPRIADRIAGSISVVACDADGNEIEGDARVGIQHRLVTESAARAPLLTDLPRQNDSEKTLERKLDAAKALKAPLEHLFTRQELEEIADEKGIKGLRQIGDAWVVKARSIPDLIEQILATQSKFIADRNAALDRKGGPVRKHTLAAEDVENVEETPEEVLIPIGFEAMAPEYQGPENIVIPAEALINSALKNSGKSLTGWNALADDKRKEAIENEIAALSEHYGVELQPIVAELESSDQPENGEGA